MSREAMKLALEALQEVYWSSRSAKHDEAITALREALAEQPVKPYRQLQDNGSKYFGESWDKAAQHALDKKAENAWELGLDYEPVHKPYRPLQDNGSQYFGDSWDTPTAQPAPVQEPVIDHSCKDTYELIMKWADIYAAQTGELYSQAAQDPSKAARMADERTMLACVVAQAISQPSAPTKKIEHITDGSPCWCNPETNYVDSETRIAVIVHREPQ